MAGYFLLYLVGTQIKSRQKLTHPAMQQTTCCTQQQAVQLLPKFIDRWSLTVRRLVINPRGTVAHGRSPEVEVGLKVLQVEREGEDLGVGEQLRAPERFVSRRPSSHSA